LGGQGNFDLCITQDPDNSACNTSDALTVTATSLGSPLAGPYLPGEQVTFCYTVTNYTQFNCNYISAFVPSFGNCWDPSSFNAQGMPNIINTPLNVNGIIQCPPGPPGPQCACAGSPAGAWSWFPSGSATYNINGYYPAGTPMPAGWYFLSSYNPATGSCTGDPTDPDLSYGDGNYPSCGVNTFDYTVCFTLIAGPVGNCGTGLTDCSVTMKTFADGEFGAWNNIGCTGDAAANYPAGFACCTPPVITSISNSSICSTGSINQALTSDQDPGVTYSWTVIAGSNITGASAGTGSTINHTLTNSGTTSQTVQYTVTANNGSCSSTSTFTVTVNPNLAVSAPSSNPIVCINLPISPVITFTTTAATGIGAATGLPGGVTASFSGNTITVSGTPNTAGTFNYTIPLVGSCGSATASGTITVQPINTVTPPSSNPTACIGLPLSPTVTFTTTGATGIGAASGLPAGLSASFSSNTITISGTPTASGTFNYT
ncbi:MAG: PKD-like domain-containing protein, partial [Bacteroidota bacterium]